MLRERRRAVLALVDPLRLPVGAQALDIGCGAGSTAIALARRGLYVYAMDNLQAMLGLTRQAVGEEKLGDRIETRRGDAERLPFNAGTFDLAIAIGLMGWLHSPKRALLEMFGALKPGGYLVVTFENKWALRCLLDPPLHPLWHSVTGPSRSSRRHFHGALAHAGFEILACRSVGFGPFTLLGRQLLDQEASVRLHHKLQYMADNGNPLLRHSGENCLVLAQKPKDDFRP